jgi:hypothetical protein
MVAEVDIANQALGFVGIGKLIQNFQSEQSAEAKQIRQHYMTALTAILESAHWNFARAQKALTLLKDASAGDTVPRPWSYEYAYPADCAQVRYIMPQTYASPGATASGYPVVVGAAPPVRFVVGIDQDDNGTDRKVILTNEPDAECVFTKVVTNPQLFDSQFVRALAAYLGHMVAMPLTNDLARAKTAFQIAASTTISAQASNGDEGLTVIESTPEWLAVRGFQADYAGGPGLYVNGPVALTMIM